MIANFVKVAQTLSAENQLFYLCGGPMEFPWRAINATPMDKRPFITCVSQSTWNEEFKDQSHTWANMKALPGGTKFLDLRDGTGFGKNSNWRDMLNFNETLTWMVSCAQLPGGATNDVSDCQMAWYIMTGSEIGTPKMIIEKLKWAFGGPVTLKPNLSDVNSYITHHLGKIEINMPNSKAYSQLIATNLIGKSVHFPITQQSQNQFLFESSKLDNGTYFLSLARQNGATRSIGKVNILH